jgi:hypothetical protein
MALAVSIARSGNLEALLSPYESMMMHMKKQKRKKK